MITNIGILCVIVATTEAAAVSFHLGYIKAQQWSLSWDPYVFASTSAGLGAALIGAIGLSTVFEFGTLYAALYATLAVFTTGLVWGILIGGTIVVQRIITGLEKLSGIETTSGGTNKSTRY